MKNLWMSWSTGKDSAYGLYKLQQDKRYRVTGLFTTVNRDFDRVAMHATRTALLRRQAEAIGLPLEIVEIPKNCSNETYSEAMSGLLEKAKCAGVQAMGFGDLFLEDVRQYREKILAGSGIEPVFPLWQKPTQVLAKEIISSGIKAVLTCVDPKKLSSSFAGRYYDASTISEFPPTVDPCGENGEFHTFVFESPSFKESIPISIGQKVERDGFCFSDIL